MRPDYPGLFVTFEGIDGSGKSTQIERCAQALRDAGHETIVTRNPGGTEFGQELRQIVLHYPRTLYPMSELLLYMSDRAQHMDEVILPALKGGKIVLCDRHGDSSLAYQGYGRGLNIQEIRELNRIATQGHAPDVTLLFDGEPALLAQRVERRGKVDRLEGEAVDFHTRVREGYLELARQEPERIRVLDATKSPALLHQMVMEILTPFLGFTLQR